MAGFVQNLLQDAVKTVSREAGNAVKGFFTADYLRDYTHASKTFRTGSYAYSPKFKFLFHVYFDINKDFIEATNSWPTDQNFGLTVKNIQLPKYSFDLATYNQYNRKRVIQTKLKYDPINITFHDDNQNLVRKLWYAYYTYHYKDATQPDVNTQTSTQNSSVNTNSSFFTYGEQNDLGYRNIYSPTIINNDWGYVGEGNLTANQTGKKRPFFKGINIYGFNQHNFVLYRLINPIIESFSHDNYDYAQGNGVMENQMSIQYETVKYYEGAVDGRAPDVFVREFGKEDHYDRTLSPIARPGAQGTILGQGGLVNAAGGIMQDLQDGNFVGAIQKAGTAANTFKNPQNILNIGTQELTNIVGSSIAGTPNRNTQFGFPTSSSSTIQNTINSVNNALGKGVKAVSSPTPVNTNQ